LYVAPCSISGVSLTKNVAVANGRITKATPTKKKGIKQEQMESTDSFQFDDMTDDNMGSFSTSGMGSFDAETGGLFDGVDFQN